MDLHYFEILWIVVGRSHLYEYYLTCIKNKLLNNTSIANHSFDLACILFFILQCVGMLTFKRFCNKYTHMSSLSLVVSVCPPVDLMSSIFEPFKPVCVLFGCHFDSSYSFVGTQDNKGYVNYVKGASN